MVIMEIKDIINSDKNKCNAYRNLPPLFVVTLMVMVGVESLGALVAGKSRWL